MSPEVITGYAFAFFAGMGVGGCIGLFFALQARKDEVQNLRQNGRHS